MMLLDDPFDLPPGRLIALDLGGARHGVATCDAAGILASPLKTLRRADTRAQDFAAIAELVAAERAVGVLVGIPGDEAARGPDEPSTQARWVRRYAGRLAGALPVPVAFWDETLSSIDAGHLLAEGRGHVSLDAAAAAIILQSFLEARRTKIPERGRV